MTRLLPRSLNSLLLSHESVLLLLVIITGALGALWAHFWLQSSNESLRLGAMLYEAQQLRGDLYTQLKEVNRARLLEDPQALRRFLASGTRLDDHFQRLLDQAEDEQERLVIDYMGQTYRAVQADMNKITADPYLFSEAVRMKILDPLYEEWMLAEFESSLQIFDQVIARRRAQLEQNLDFWSQRIPWLIPIPIVLAVALLLWSWRSLQRGFVRPMQALTEGVHQLSRGDLEYRIDERGVTEVRQLVRGFNDMATELAGNRQALATSERQAALGALVPVVAHNIRNPLASIRALAQIMDDPQDSDELQETRTAIIATIDRLERWVSALLSYLHPLRPHPRMIDLTTVIDGALEPLITKIDARQIDVQRVYDATAQVAIDVDLFEQALYGLLNNAVDASPERARLSLSLHADESMVTLCIDDEGTGIPFDPQPGALSPGPTTKRFGTGLGIPFAFKVCSAHDCDLQFEARPQGGTRVRLTLAKAQEITP